jgi:hypothetical protein
VRSDITENSRQKIAEVMDLMRAGVPGFDTMDKDSCPVTHRFAPGCYIREIFMPKHSVVIGKIHKTEHFNTILHGSVTVVHVNDEGKLERNHYQAPCTFVSKAGVQKCVLMHTDCLWQTIHITKETDVDKIEQDIIAESYDDLLIESLKREVLS